MATESQQVIASTTGANWKKVLLWCGGILTALVALILPIIWLAKKQGPIDSAKDEITKTREEILRIDADAKAEAARLAGYEARIVEQVRQAAMLPDEKARADALAALLAEDY